MVASPPQPQGAPPRVAVLMGGPDDEHDISLRSGAAVAEALAAAGGFVVTPVVLERGGMWRFGTPVGGEGDGASDEPPKTPGRALDRLRRDADVAFLALHGRVGEGGLVQGALEVAGVPFVGSPTGASALAMDKAASRAVYAAERLPIADGEVVAPDEERAPARMADDIASRLGLPVFCKPLDSGSSYGVAVADDIAALAGQIDAARGAGRPLLVEARVHGDEYTVAVLERDDGPIALPPVAIVPKGGARFFTLDVKYDPSAVDEICPAPAPPERLARLRDLGLRAHRALGCRDLSRTDIIWGPDGAVLLETNTIPGFTAASLYPKAAAAAGRPFPDLCAHLVRRALARARA